MTEISPITSQIPYTVSQGSRVCDLKCQFVLYLYRRPDGFRLWTRKEKIQRHPISSPRLTQGSQCQLPLALAVRVMEPSLRAAVFQTNFVWSVLARRCKETQDELIVVQ